MLLEIIDVTLFVSICCNCTSIPSGIANNCYGAYKIKLFV